MNDKLKSQKKEFVNELPNKEYMKQVVSNVIDEEYLTHVFCNISNMGMKEVQAKMDVLSRGKQYYCLLYNQKYAASVSQLLRQPRG